MIRIVIATQPTHHVPTRVLEYSIRRHSAAELDIRPTSQPEGVERKGGTRFSFVRFLIPHMFGYRGRAIYMDADQLVLHDVQELIDSLDDDHAIALVKEPEGMFAGEPVESRNETSVMVLDCEKLKSWDPDHLFENVIPNKKKLRPGQIHYKDFMRLEWVAPHLIQALDPRWNHYNLVREDTRNVHFSHVRDQPWIRPSHALTGFWSEWLEKTIRDGFLSRREILKEVALLHLHPHFLRHVVARG
jgi:lipopolysaccharide biosynthesis glycosyltransferase